MRILALDWGEVRIGAAVSDPDGKIAFPLEKVIESKNAAKEIKALTEKLEVEKIVIGMPKNLSGAESESSKKVEAFIENLKSQVPVETLDERFSTVAASKALQEQGIPEKKQRAIKDNIAAQIMLQSYLDKTINNQN